MKSINIREMARQLNCSASTVSRVLSGRRDESVRISEKTRKRILDYCAEHHYTPSIHASRLFSRQSRTIGFLNEGGLEEDQNLARSLFTVCSELFAAGYRCLPLQSDTSFVKEKEYLKVFERQEIDALIVWGTNERYEYLDELASKQLPFFLLTNRMGEYPAVYADQQTPVAEMVRDCKRRGASRFAFVGLNEGDSYRQRLSGFEEEAGAEQRIFFVEQSFENGYAIAPKLLNYRPDAILCANDYTAVGVEKYLLETGVKIPDDLLLTGGDNLPIAKYCTVPVTTFDQQAACCARECVHRLLELLTENRPLTSFRIKTEVIYRASSGHSVPAE